MTRLIRSLALPILALGAVSCDGDPSAPEPITSLPRELSLAEQDVIRGSNAFAFDLLREVRAARPDSPNTFLSPLSASMALGMAMNGADGSTWSQMRDALGFDGLEEAEINAAYRDLIALLLELDPAVELGLGNAVWVDRRVTLLDPYTQRLTDYFGAEAAELDFTAPGTVQIINDWVSDVTRGRIERLLDSIPPDVLMYLVNAIYFKGDWRDRFDRSRTADASFTRADGRTVTVDMMDGKVGRRVILGGDPAQIQAVELPYGGGAFAAVAILPPADQDIDTFVASLDPVLWDAWVDQLDAAAAAEDPDRAGIQVRLPKFELEWGDSLVGPLRALGMVDAFEEHAADFSRMTGARDLLITQVIQKTYVRVDEEGTEAAAATAVGMGPVSLPPSLTFDRPFLFAIRERFSGAILFMGVIGDPS